MDIKRLSRVQDSKIQDNIGSDGSCIVWHSTRAKDLAEIILNKDFNTGSGYGSMLGPGFYANLQLHQAQKHNYGPFILKASIYNLNKFIILEYESFKRAFPDAPATEDNFLEYQSEKFGVEPLEVTDKRYVPSRRGERPKVKVDMLSASMSNKYQSTAQYAKWLNDKNIRAKCKKMRPVGFIYRGMYDGLSLVCWYPKLYVIPLGISEDDGKTWKEVNKEEFEKELAEKNAKHQERFDRQDEDLRSDQRAADLKNKIIHLDNTDKLAHIRAHLKKIKNQDKFEKRRDAIAREFPNLKEQINKFEFGKL